MEADLRKAEREDWERGAHMMQKARNEDDTTAEKRQCKLVLDIRERLREYSKIEDLNVKVIEY